MWLFGDNEMAASNLRKEATSRNIEPSRIVFAKRIPNEEHLARYRLADLFLDTFPYNAHTTASDALWVGTPILTLEGATFASRVAASILHSIQLPELITCSIEDYESLAVQLALDPARLAAIKANLERNKSTAPLFDTQLFTEQIESAYQTVYDQYYAGLIS
jgi:predicted O-linked N-acetylglucosamine transferase (SPINDLY family)